jgi:hypothetical protein
VKYALMLALSVASLSICGGFLAPLPAHAVVCARGVYRAGCAGPNGGAVVRRPPVYHHGSSATVSCARGPYRAGCAGPNGAVVRRY